MADSSLPSFQSGKHELFLLVEQKECIGQDEMDIDLGSVAQGTGCLNGEGEISSN
jgi:hypothetical protein